MELERAKPPRLLGRDSAPARRCRQAGLKGLISGRGQASGAWEQHQSQLFAARHPDTMGKLVALTVLGASLALIGERLLNFR